MVFWLLFSRASYSAVTKSLAEMGIHLVLATIQPRFLQRGNRNVDAQKCRIQHHATIQPRFLQRGNALDVTRYVATTQTTICERQPLARINRTRFHTLVRVSAAILTTCAPRAGPGISTSPDRSHGGKTVLCLTCMMSLAFPGHLSHAC